MNKLAIFDLDGTLCDTLPDLKYYVNLTCEKFGYPVCDTKKVRNEVCSPSFEFLIGCMGAENAKIEDQKKYHEFYSKEYRASKSPRTRLFDGMEEALNRLKNAGFKLVIFTNKAQDQADIIYDKYIKQVRFDKVLGIKDGVIPKPEPDEIFKSIEEFGSDKENTYFVGDGDTDVLASLRAGVNLIAVTYGYRDKEILQDLGAKVFADSPKEIADIILGE